MKKSVIARASFVSFALVGTAACGGSTAPPASGSTAAASTVAAEQSPAGAERRAHGRGIAAMLVATLDSMQLRPEQQAAVKGIEADLAKLRGAGQAERMKLVGDTADGVAAGALDQAKITADLQAFGAALDATAPSLQDAVNRLHQTLEPVQRAELVAKLRERGPKPGERGQGPMGPRPERPGMRGGPLMKLADELGLSAEQKQDLRGKLRAQFEGQREAMKEKLGAAAQHLKAVGDAFETPAFDAKSVGVGSQAGELATAIAGNRVDFVQTVLSVLTPEQRAKFAAQVRARGNEPEGAPGVGSEPASD